MTTTIEMSSHLSSILIILNTKITGLFNILKQDVEMMMIFTSRFGSKILYRSFWNIPYK